MTDDAPITVDATCAPRPAAGLRIVEIDDEIVLHDASGVAVHLLSPTGALVWPLFDGTARLGDLASDVAAAFDADESVVLADLTTFVETLAERGLVELS